MEYLVDYASPQTRAEGLATIQRELTMIEDSPLKKELVRRLEAIKEYRSTGSVLLTAMGIASSPMRITSDIVHLFRDGRFRFAMIGMMLCVSVVLSTTLTGCRESPDKRRIRLAKEGQRAEYVQKLRSYVPAEVLKTVPEEFYNDPGFRDHWRFPLTYPYSVSVIDTFDNPGSLKDARKAKVDKGWKEITDEEQVLYGLTRLAFDSKTLVARIEHDTGFADSSQPSIITWLVFDFATGKEEDFESESAAVEEAQRRGFSAPIVLEPLETHYERCFPP